MACSTAFSCGSTCLGPTSGTRPAIRTFAARAALLTTMEGGTLLRLIAGELGGHSGPGSTFTPITMVHATVSPGASVQLPWRPDFNALAYVLAGRGSAGAEHRPVRVGQLVVYGPGDAVTLTADVAQDASSNFEVLLLGGQPIGGPWCTTGPSS